MKAATAKHLAQMERRHRLTAAQMRAGMIEPLPPSRLRSGIFETHARLQLSELAKAGLRVEGEAHVAFASWDNDRTGLRSSAIQVNLKDPIEPFIVITSVGSNGGEIQVILLSDRDRSTRGLRYFICPSNGSHVATLVYRDGRWASMKAQNLKNKSQRSDRFAGHDILGYRDDDR